MLSKEIQQKTPFASLEEEAFLSLLRTAAVLEQELTRLLKPHGLTPSRYNALRILRGSHPQRLTCGEIGERLVSPVPDVTRLVDGLVRSKLALRGRDEADRRVVRVGITQGGLTLLRHLDEPIADFLEQSLANVQPSRLRTLLKTLAALRG